jgi:hypothetical protein
MKTHEKPDEVPVTQDVYGNFSGGGGAQWSAFFNMGQILKILSPKWALLTKII